MLNTMKNIIGFALFLGLAFVSPDAHAQAQNPTPNDATTLKIALLDLASIRRQSLVVKNISDQILAYRDGFRENIQKEEAALKTANQELAKKRTLLSPEAFAQERRNFEQKVLAVQQLVQKSKRALDQAQAAAMVEVEKVLNKIITGIAEERNLNLILRQDITILASRSLEITGDVLKQLNEQLPTVKVDKPVTE